MIPLGWWPQKDKAVVVIKDPWLLGVKGWGQWDYKIISQGSLLRWWNSCILVMVMVEQIYTCVNFIVEKAMATHSSPLAWQIPWTEGPCGLQSMGSLGVRHNWATSLSLFAFMHWRRQWQPTPVFLPGESQGWRSLVGCHLWSRTESDTTEVT